MIINIITDAISRGWENFISRPDGPMNFRFILQPLLVSFFAIRAGIKDAKKGNPAFLWDAIFNASHRQELFRNGWKDLRMPFTISLLLDAVYQVIIHHFVYPLELLFTAVLLAIIPYLILRGPAKRIAEFFLKKKVKSN